jgi:tetratricopeptide (TPR) repeat protein
VEWVPPERILSACSAIIDARAETPDNLATAYCNRSMAYGETKGGIDRALADAEAGIRLGGGRVISIKCLGQKHLLAGENDQAVSAYSEAIKISPEDNLLLVHRAVAHGRMKAYELAIADLDKAIERHPRAVAFISRGAAYAGKQDDDHAIADYGEAIRLDPQYATAFANRGIAYARKQNYQRAIVDYDEAIRLDSKNVSTFVNRAAARARRQEYDVALADYDEAIRLDSQSAAAWQGRGQVLALKGSAEARARLYLEEASKAGQGQRK